MVPRSRTSAERRRRTASRGRIESITVAAATAAPSFSVLLAESGTPADQDARTASAGPRSPRRVRLTWIGQRSIAGIHAGAELKFEGMLSQADGVPTIYNPRYELVCRPRS